jgi:hypothetical protein
VTDPDPNERHLIVSLQQAGTRLANQLAKAEREVRDTALDRDRWKKRAQEAEATIRLGWHKIQKKPASWRPGERDWN